MKTHFIYGLLCFSLAFCNSSGQCTYQITHVSGSNTINGVNVTVTRSGKATQMMYCGPIFPYWIGQIAGIAGTGSYTFSFQPPVSAVSLSYGAISNVVGIGTEELSHFVNNNYFPMIGPLVANPCEPLAVITPAGTITGCNSCSGSGLDRIYIPGPIHTLTVVDSVMSGQPNGTVFSLYICDPVVTGVDGQNFTHTLLYPNPVAHNLNITTDQKGIIDVTIYDIEMQRIIHDSFSGYVNINTSPLAKGVYFYEMTDSEGIFKKGLLVKE